MAQLTKQLQAEVRFGLKADLTLQLIGVSLDARFPFGNSVKPDKS